METNLERREGRLTLARVHSVLAAISVVMIGQITSVNPITPQLQCAAWYFGASILLNTFFYILEMDSYSPRCKSRLTFIVFILHSAAISVFLAGLSNMVGHFSWLAGLLFAIFGNILWVYLFFVLSRNRLIPMKSQSDLYRLEVDEFRRQAEVGIWRLEEIKQEYDDEVRRQTTGDGAAYPVRKQEIAGKLEEKRAELNRLVAEHMAILEPRKAELDRLIGDVYTLLPRVVRSSED